MTATPPDGLIPDSAILPNDSSVLEVNGAGGVTASAAGIGDVAATDPFAFVAPGQQPTNDPMASQYMPSADPNATSNSGAGYTPTSDPSTQSYSTGVTAPVGGFSAEQVQNAQIIAQVGHEVGASQRDIQTALAAAIVESGLQNLDYGDRDSIGMFQQRNAWGSRADRLDPAKAARMFFLGGASGERGLLDIKNRNQMSVGAAAQAVQVSAYPDRYAQHANEALTLLQSLGTGSQSGKTTTGQVGGAEYGKTTVDGQTVDNLTAAALQAADKVFGGHLHVEQGSYNAGGVAASGGTHDGGGVVDISVAPGQWGQAVDALRQIGFAAWHRLPSQGPWPEHIHAVLIGDAKMAPQAQVQVTNYLQGSDGLAGGGADNGPRQWVNNRFSWGDAQAANAANSQVSAPGDAALTQQPNDFRQQAVNEVSKYLGTPFKWGGTDFSGVDASGLIHAVYKRLGLSLPNSIYGQAFSNDPIPVDQVQPGDLVVWSQHPATGAEHVGMFVGDGQVIDAAGPGRAVQLSMLGDVTHAWGVPVSPTEPVAEPMPQHSITPTPQQQTSYGAAPAPMAQAMASSPALGEPHHTAHHSSAPAEHGYGYGGTTFGQKPHPPTN